MVVGVALLRGGRGLDGAEAAFPEADQFVVFLITST